MSVRERRPEIGVLKVLGFSSVRIVLFYLVEALLVASAGGIAGLVAAFLAVQSVAPFVTQIAPGMALSPAMITLGLALMAFVALLAVAAPAFYVSRLPAMAAFRRG